MSLWFRVEYIRAAQTTGIFVRQLQHQDFQLGPAATLGGCRIQHAVSQPRALKADGTLDRDVFVFHLTDGTDRRTFTVGIEVELIP